jgi:hypothetical protein
MAAEDEGNGLCIKMCIYIYIVAFFIKTVAIFSATYTLQQLNRTLRNKQKGEQKNELVTVPALLHQSAYSRPNFASIPALQKYSGA